MTILCNGACDRHIVKFPRSRFCLYPEQDEGRERMSEAAVVLLQQPANMEIDRVGRVKKQAVVTTRCAVSGRAKAPLYCTCAARRDG